jgi:hypothetical protein
MVERTEHLDGKVVFGFVISRSDLDSGDILPSMIRRHSLVWDSNQGRFEESEIISDEPNGTARPCSGVNGLRDHIHGRPSFAKTGRICQV